MLDDPISVWLRMPASASALFALPGVPSADAAISPGFVISAGLTAIVEALVPVKNAPPALPFRSNPAACCVLVALISVLATVSSCDW